MATSGTADVPARRPTQWSALPGSGSHIRPIASYHGLWLHVYRARLLCTTCRFRPTLGFALGAFCRRSTDAFVQCPASSSCSVAGTSRSNCGGGVEEL